MRVVHYTRVSTEEQKNGYLVDDQLSTLRAYSASRGDEVVEEIRLDEGYSGADPDRPGLARILELAESGSIEAVVAVKRDRIFRSRLYRLLFERDLEEYGVSLIALNDVGHRIGDGVLELARIGSLLFIFVDPPNDQIGSSSPIDTFATRLSAQPLKRSRIWKRRGHATRTSRQMAS